MYVVTGASGNTGSVVANTLLDNHKQVKVIGRTAEHLQPFTKRGAEAVIADLTDTGELVRAFSEAEAVYAMIPPNPAAPNTFAYEDRIMSSLVSALTEARVRNVVALSSVGADKSGGTGLVVALHRLEQALDRVPALNTLHLRAGYFMENTLPQVGIIKGMGVVAGPIRADLKLPMIASHDIGVAAANHLLRLDFQGHQTRELLGQRDLSYAEAAALIGKAIGNPGLKYQQLPDEQLRPNLASFGMSPNFIDLLLEMSAALNSGYMKALESRTADNTTPTSFERFVAERFVPAYQALSTAA
jgi:uncharacterized protein YbjT (DUF2867 family)